MDKRVAVFFFGTRLSPPCVLILLMHLLGFAKLTHAYFARPERFPFPFLPELQGFPRALGALGQNYVLIVDKCPNAKKTPQGGLFAFARPERFERPTYWFVASCSIQLSYGRMLSSTRWSDYRLASPDGGGRVLRPCL